MLADALIPTSSQIRETPLTKKTMANTLLETGYYMLETPLTRVFLEYKEGFSSLHTKYGYCSLKIIQILEIFVQFFMYPSSICKKIQSLITNYH